MRARHWRGGHREESPGPEALDGLDGGLDGGLDDALVVTGHGADMATGEIPFGVLADTLRDLAHRPAPTR